MGKHRFLSSFYILLVLAFLFLPIVILVIFSFNSAENNVVFSGFTFDWYSKLWQNHNLLEAFGNTLLIAFISTAVSTVIGTISAVGFKKFNFRFEQVVNKLIYIPIVIPEIVIGIALLSVFSLFHIELSFWTILIAHISFSVPFVITNVNSVLYSYSDSIEEAAEDLGANDWQTFWHVTLPLIKPGIISGALLAFTLSLDDVVISFFTAGPSTNTLPLYIYSIIKTGITPDVNALITLMLIVTTVAITASFLIKKRTNEKYRNAKN